MVWGGNRYVEILVGGGANPKKVPQMKKKKRKIGPSPHGKKCSQCREKCSKKPPTLRKSSKDALYKDKKGPQMEKNVAKSPHMVKNVPNIIIIQKKYVAKRPPHDKKVCNIVII